VLLRLLTLLVLVMVLLLLVMLLLLLVLLLVLLLLLLLVSPEVVLKCNLYKLGCAAGGPPAGCGGAPGPLGPSAEGDQAPGPLEQRLRCARRRCSQGPWRHSPWREPTSGSRGDCSERPGGQQRGVPLRPLRVSRVGGPQGCLGSPGAGAEPERGLGKRQRAWNWRGWGQGRSWVGRPRLGSTNVLWSRAHRGTQDPASPSARGCQGVAPCRAHLRESTVGCPGGTPGGAGERAGGRVGG